MVTVAERIVQTLEAANVQRIYGLVGDSLNGITEALRVRKKIHDHSLRGASFCSASGWLIRRG
jgi:pyruvate dehydrogenase (quinone)